MKCTITDDYTTISENWAINNHTMIHPTTVAHSPSMTDEQATADDTLSEDLVNLVGGTMTVVCTMMAHMTTKCMVEDYTTMVA